MRVYIAFIGHRHPALAAEDFFAAPAFRANRTRNHRQPHRRDRA
jgi:hypothetical protein